MDRMDRIRERIEAVIDPEYMHDNGLTPNEVAFFIFDILKSEGIIMSRPTLSSSTSVVTPSSSVYSRLIVSFSLI